MRRFVLEQNIERFERALAGTLTDAQRITMTQLLEETHSELNRLMAESKQPSRYS